MSFSPLKTLRWTTLIGFATSVDSVRPRSPSLRVSGLLCQRRRMARTMSNPKPFAIETLPKGRFSG
jgi:hypothetical protein